LDEWIYVHVSCVRNEWHCRCVVVSFRPHASSPAHSLISDPGSSSRYFLKNGECIECPDGSECKESDTAYTIETIVVEDGFWRTSATSEKVKECPTPAYCKGNESLTGSLCAEGHTGAYCEVCIEGYGKMSDGTCEVRFSRVNNT
jgi:hypothetical protein